MTQLAVSPFKTVRLVRSSSADISCSRSQLASKAADSTALLGWVSDPANTAELFKGLSRFLSFML